MFYFGFKIPTTSFIYVIFLFLNLSFLIIPAHSQNSNPRYPRIGQMYLYWPVQGPEIWKKHGLVMIRHKYNEAAQEIKRLNPDVILLAANDYIVTQKDKWPDDWYLKCDRSMWGNSHCTSDGKLYAGREDYPLMNITPQSPVVNYTYGNQKFNQFLAEYLVKNTDYNYFDGTIFDYWARQIWGNKVNYADINNDFVADGKDVVNAQWERGNEALVNNLRALLPELLILSNEGGSYQTYTNGNMFEFWSKNQNKQKKVQEFFNYQQNAIQPVVIYANSEAGLSGSPSAGDFTGAHWRVDFTMAQIAGVFVGHDEGTVAHRFTFLHDEYEADLGYPLSGSAGEPKEIESGFWVRFFDNGAVISNISGSSKIAHISQLDGREYWRFKGAQEPAFNNGERFTSVYFAAYDGIMLFTEPTTLITPIVIDNVPKNMTSLGQSSVIYSGNWEQIRWGYKTKVGKTSYGLGISWGSEGYMYAINKQKGTALYRPKINVPGEYEIYGWHPDVRADGQGDGCSNVKITINHAGGTTTKFVDQTLNVGRWNSLGRYSINNGNMGTVVIDASGGCITASDAIRFVYGDATTVTDTTPPEAPKEVKVGQN